MGMGRDMSMGRDMGTERDVGTEGDVGIAEPPPHHGQPLQGQGITGTDGVGVDMGLGGVDKEDWGRRIWGSSMWGDKGSMMGMMGGCRRATLENPKGDMSGGGS